MPGFLDVGEGGSPGGIARRRGGRSGLAVRRGIGRGGRGTVALKMPAIRRTAILQATGGLGPGRQPGGRHGLRDLPQALEKPLRGIDGACGHSADLRATRGDSDVAAAGRGPPQLACAPWRQSTGPLKAWSCFSGSPQPRSPRAQPPQPSRRGGPAGQLLLARRAERGADRVEAPGSDLGCVGGVGAAEAGGQRLADQLGPIGAGVVELALEFAYRIGVGVERPQLR